MYMYMCISKYIYLYICLYVCMHIYADPVGIPKGERFSWNEETVEDIRRRNSDLKYAR